MKKAFSITLSGIVFTIEEDAYAALNDYFESIKKHYKSQEGEEIVVDIEASLAEKFADKKNKKQVIALKDVQEAIKILGTVEEFSREADEEAKIEAGFGKEKEGSPKRLYRNPDDVIIAGVCSGLAVYFRIDPVWMRLLFIILALIDGIGILIYLVLWIVVPSAKTSPQKLEMRGKPVDLKRIEQTIKNKSRELRQEGKMALKNLKNQKSLFYKILNLPVKIVQYIFIFLKKSFKVIIPLVRILLGSVFLVSMVLIIFALSLSLGILLFNINSPYLVSDIPLAEFSNSLSYYTGLAGIYFIVLIPLLFLLILGITLLRSRNSFKVPLSSVLITIWMFSVIAVVVSAVDLAPQIQETIEQLNQAEKVTRYYDFEGIKNLRIGANTKVEVLPGEEFFLEVSGRQRDIERLIFKENGDELQIVQAGRGKGICFICFDHPVDMRIALPELERFVAFGQARVNLAGFEEDIRVNAGESARVTFRAEGQEVKSYIAGLSGQVEVLGSPRSLEAVLEGFGRLIALELKTEKVKVDASVASRVDLAGETQELEVNLEDLAKFYAFDLKALRATVNVFNQSLAEIQVVESLKAMAGDLSKIYYRGQPSELETQKTRAGSVIFDDKDIQQVESKGIINYNEEEEFF